MMAQALAVAVPALEDPDQRRTVADSLAGAAGRHTVIDIDGEPGLDLLERAGIRADSMGRTIADDPAFFLAAAAAGALAAGLARDGQPPGGGLAAG